MSETLSSAQPPASAAVSEKSERLRIAWVTGGILFALMVVVVALRFYRLSELPPGLAHDEGVDGVLALRVLQGEHALFFLGPGSSGRDASTIYALTLSTSLFGRTLLAMHLPTVLGSAGMVFVVFWLGRLLFGRDENGQATPWRGLLIGGVGAGLLAVSLGQTILGRTSFNNITHMPLLLALCLALFWSGWRHRVRRSGAWWRIALAGACAGLLPYTYFPARFTPILFLLFGLSFLLPSARSGDGGERSKRDSLFLLRSSRLRAELTWVGIFVGVAGLVAAPLLVHFVLHPEHLFWRSGQLWVFSSGRSQGDLLTALWGNVWEHLMVFGLRGDLNWGRNFADQPMLNSWEAFFFWLGVGMAVWRWHRPAYRLLLLWLCTLILPAMLARDFAPPPNTLRMIGAAPATYLLIGVGMWEAFKILRERWRAIRIFRENETRLAIALGAVVGGSVLVQGLFTYQTYFQKWAVAPETYKAYETEWTELAHTLNAQPSDVDNAYLISYKVNGHPSFEYLYQGDAPVHIVRGKMPDLAQKLRSTLAAMENLSTVRVVDWSADSSWAEDGDENIIVLLQKHGRYLGSEEYAAFRIHTYTDIALDRPWTFYEYLEPLTVHYDGGIDLCGLALGQGQEQLSTQHRLDLGQERALWVGLQWQTTPGLNADYAISLRLYNSGGEKSYQEDAVLGNPDHARTRHWSAGEAVDTLFHLNFPAELPPGEYELRLIVYDAETLIPTVEIDVWQPETVLARLQLAEPQ